MRHPGLLTLCAIVIGLRAGTASTANPHAVTLRLTAFTPESVVVHVVKSQLALPLAAPTAPTSGRFIDTLTVRTPVDLRVDSAIKRLQLSTERNLAIRVRFTDGASGKEQALAPWGRRLSFVRSADGDLAPEAEVMPAHPTRSR